MPKESLSIKDKNTIVDSFLGYFKNLKSNQGLDVGMMAANNITKDTQHKNTKAMLTELKTYYYNPIHDKHNKLNAQIDAVVKTENFDEVLQLWKKRTGKAYPQYAF